MEHAAGACSTPPTNSTRNRNVKTPFLTPCRRMGLARKSPASSGNWHANKSSPGAISPYKSPLKVIEENCSDTLLSEHDSVENQVTPSRNIRTLHKRHLTKRLKTSHSLPSVSCNADGESTMITNKSQSSGHIEAPSAITTKIETILRTSDTETNVILPQEDITDEMIKDVHKRIKQKEEKLKDLKLASLYKKKHDVNTLQNLIQTWLEGCQTALQELQSVLLTQGHQLSIEELLNQLNIPPKLVKYRTDLEEFE